MQVNFRPASSAPKYPTIGQWSIFRDRNVWEGHPSGRSSRDWPNFFVVMASTRKVAVDKALDREEYKEKAKKNWGLVPQQPLGLQGLYSLI